MITFIKDFVLIIVAVSIFSTVILTIIGENNSLREIVKIACGCLMIVALILPFKKNMVFDEFNFSNIYDDYKETASEAIIAGNFLEKKLIEENLEKLVYEQTGQEVIIRTNDDYTIETVKVLEGFSVEKICDVIGINEDAIEYIKK